MWTPQFWLKGLMEGAYRSGQDFSHLIANISFLLPSSYSYLESPVNHTNDSSVQVLIQREQRVPLLLVKESRQPLVVPVPGDVAALDPTKRKETGEA